ncbi:hypothetical protein B0H13DRAFT_1871234 [Mycena leptocephala]|nr:hypothetical protein B0H13DRAFT_1871234 [Mycena leptocephala]
MCAGRFEPQTTVSGSSHEAMRRSEVGTQGGLDRTNLLTVLIPGPGPTLAWYERLTTPNRVLLTSSVVYQSLSTILSTYGIYSVLFCQSVHVLLSRRRANYKFHLACMIVLFLLSTIHVALAYAWAFITDTGDAAIYEFASWANPLPVLYAPGDPVSILFVKVSKPNSDALLENDHDLLLVQLQMLSFLYCHGIIHQRVGGGTSRRTNLVDISTSPQLFRKKNTKEISGFDGYPGIAPTLIIVRVGLGVSTDDVEKSVTISGTPALPSFVVEMGPEITLELEDQVAGDELQERFRDNKVLPIRAGSNIS